MDSDHRVEVMAPERPDGRHSAVCSCGERAESRTSDLVDAWVAFHLAQGASPVPATAQARAG